jgi:hypothetical protein
MWLRSSTFVIALALAAGCGSGSAAPPGSSPRSPAYDPAGSPGASVLRLRPGHYTFHVGRDVRVGQRIRCFTDGGRPAGGGSVEPRGHGVGASTGFEAVTSANGRVRVACPVSPGNA